MIVATSCPINKKIGAEFIKWYQGTEFSHVLIIDNDLVYQASHGLVNCTYIDNFLSENKIINFYEIDDLDVDMDFVKKQLGKKYGTLQLIWIPLNKIFKYKYKSNGNQKFICSEFVGKALKLDWINDLTTPKEIDDYLKSRYQ